MSRARAALALLTVFVAVGLVFAPAASASSVSNVTAPVLSSPASAATAVEYEFQFTASTAMTSASTVTVSAPAGTALTTGCDNALFNVTKNQSAGCGGTLSNGNTTLTLDVSQNVSPGDLIRVTLRRVTNPAPGTYSLQVSTSSDVDPVSSPTYTITPGNTSVSELTAPVLSSPASGATAVEYEFQFKVSATGGLTSDSTVTVAAPAGTVLTSGCDNALFNVTKNQGAGCGGVLSNGNTTLALNVSNDVSPGDVLRVTLRRITNPAPGTYTLGVSTTSDVVPVTTPSYTIAAGNQSVSDVTPPAVSSSTSGATAVEYEFQFKVSPTGGLTSDSTVTVTAPAGTVLTSGCDNALFNVTKNQGAGCGGVLSNGNTTLALNVGNDVSPGDVLRVTLRQITNAAPGTYTLSVSTTSDVVPVATPSYTITAGNQSVSEVSAPVLSSPASGATAVEYELQFRTSPTGGLTSDSTVTVTAPAGTVLTSGCDNALFNVTKNQGAGCGGVLSNGSTTLALNVGNDVSPGDVLRVTLRQITNPAPGTYTLSVSTTTDRTPVNTPPYTITAGNQSVSNVSTAVSNAAPGATGVEYRVTFRVSPTGGLTSDSTVTIAAPAGTVLTSGCTNQIFNLTKNQGAGCGGVLSNGNSTLALNVSGDVSPGDVLRVTLAGVTNPPSGSPLSVWTTSDTNPVVSPAYISPIPAVPSVTGISPNSGPAAGGTVVTVTGTGFTTANEVRFGPNPASSFSVLSDTQITATAPAGSGTVDVVVSTLGGVSPTSINDRFTYTGGPSVSSISPTSGPAAGGTSVTVSGSGFTGATGVSFGSAAATSFNVVSDTQVIATSPGGTGTVDVTVTTPAGTSPTHAADRFTYTVTPTTTTTTTLPTTTTTTTVPPTTTTTTTTTVPPTATTSTTTPATTTTALPATTTTVPATTTTLPDTATTTLPDTTTTVPEPTTTTVPAPTTTLPEPTPTTVPETTTAAPAPSTSAVPTTSAATGTTVPRTTTVSPATTVATTTAPSTTTTTVAAPTTTVPGSPLVAAAAPATPPAPPAAAAAGDLLAVSVAGVSEGPPGVGLRVAGEGYPSTCRTVYVFFDGTRIGTASPDGMGRIVGERLVVPGDADPGTHQVTTSCQSSGQPVVQAATFEVLEDDTHRVALVTALPRPHDVDFSLGALLASAAVVAGLLFLIAFPGELFNSTLEAHYDEVRGWFGLGPKRPEERSGRTQVLPFVAFLLAGGVLVSLLNPAFGFDKSSLAAAVGLTIAIGVVTLAYDVPTLAYVRRNHGDWGRLVILPGTILIGVACVVLSRVVHFLPGYFYGLIAGLAFRRQIADVVRGRLTAFSTGLVLALSVASWLAMAPVSGAADKPGASVALLVLEAALGGIFWCGLDSLVIGMLPLRFLGGSEVRKWSRLGWTVLFVLTQMAFVHILLRPSTGYVADTTHSPTAIVITLFAGFALFSVAFWAYFRYRSPRMAPDQQPAWVEAH